MTATESTLTYHYGMRRVLLPLFFPFWHEGKTHAFTQILVSESCIPHLFYFKIASPFSSIFESKENMIRGPH